MSVVSILNSLLWARSRFLGTRVWAFLIIKSYVMNAYYRLGSLGSSGESFLTRVVVIRDNIACEF